MDGRAIAGLILSLGALICGVVATAVNKWYIIESRKNYKYFGLWSHCLLEDGEKTSTCQKWNSENSWVHGCQALMIIGVIAVAIAMILIIVKTVPNKWSAVCLTLAGLCLVTAAIVFGAKIRVVEPQNLPNHAITYRKKHLDAGFGLAITSGVICIVGAIVEALSEEVTPYRQF